MTTDVNNLLIVFIKSYLSLPKVVATVKSEVAYSSGTADAYISTIVARTGQINRLTNTQFYFSRVIPSSNSGGGSIMWHAYGY